MAMTAMLAKAVPDARCGRRIVLTDAPRSANSARRTLDLAFLSCHQNARRHFSLWRFRRQPCQNTAFSLSVLMRLSAQASRLIAQPTSRSQIWRGRRSEATGRSRFGTENGQFVWSVSAERDECERPNSPLAEPCWATGRGNGLHRRG